MRRRLPSVLSPFVVAAIVSLTCYGAAAQSLKETVSLILTGSAKDRMGLVEIQDASACVVKLRSRRTEFFSLFRFENVDPTTIAFAGRRGNRYMTFSGPAPIVEIHSTRAGISAVSAKVQISIRHPDRERRSFERLYREFCTGRPPSGAQAGS